MAEVYIQVIDMDTLVKEQIVQNHDGSYTIFLNARHSFETHMQSYVHAMEHIVNGDFADGDVDIIEKERHDKNGYYKLQSNDRGNSIRI